MLDRSSFEIEDIPFIYSPKDVITQFNYIPDANYMNLIIVTSNIIWVGCAQRGKLKVTIDTLTKEFIILSQFCQNQ